MIMTIVPGSVTVAAGTATWASTLATATAVPGSRPVQAAASAVRPPARSPTWRRSRRIFVSTTSANAGSRAAEVGRVGEAVALRPHRLVAGRARVPRLDPGQLPDDPVGRLEQAVRGGVDLRRLVEDLEGLREEPLRRDLAAVAVQPVLPGRPGDLVDAVRLGLRGVVLPELDPGVRVRAEGGEHREGGAVGGRREHRARRHVDPDADDVGRVHGGLADDRRDRGLEHVEVVVGVLERPVGRQDHVLVRGGSRSSMTPLRYGVTDVASCRPSATSTSTARPDSVPKSTPIAYRLIGSLDSSGPPSEDRDRRRWLGVRYRSR